MGNRERYEAEINHSNDYRVTIRAFREWLKDKNMADEFQRQLKDEELTLYDIACDFSIPVAMVKLFKRTA